MSLRRHFIPVGTWEPDRPFLDDPSLDEATAALPVFNGYRPIPKLKEYVVETTPGTGMGARIPYGLYAHLSSEGIGVRQVHTIADAAGFTQEATGNLEDEDENPLEFWEHLTGVSADDSSYIYFPHMDVGGWRTAILNLESITDPIDDPASDHTVRVRYLAVGGDIGAWNIEAEIGQWADPVWTGVLLDTAGDETGTGDSNGVWQVYKFSEKDLAALPDLDYGNLYIRIRVKFDDANLTHLDPEFVDDGDVEFEPKGGASNLIEGVEGYLGTVADDTDYIGSKESVPADTEVSIRFIMEVPDADPDTAGDHKLKIRAYAENAGVKMTSKLYELIDTGIVERTDPDTPYEHDIAVDVEGGTGVNYIDTLTQAEVDSIIDPKRLYLEAVFEASGSASGEYMPDGSINQTYWTDKVGGTSNLHLDIDEDDNDNEYVKTPNDTLTGKALKVDIPVVSDPGTDEYENIKVVFRARNTVDSQWRLIWRLKQGATTIVGTRGTGKLRTFFGQQTYTLSRTEAEKINWTLPFRVEIEKEGSSANQVTVSWMKLQIPSAGGKVYMSSCEIETPAAAEIRVSWCEEEAPLPSGSEVTPGDQHRVICGAAEKLYEILSDEYRDASRAVGGDYAIDGNFKAWQFSSWGSDVIATNFADEVQTLLRGATKFTKLINPTGAVQYDTDGGLYPRARFVYPCASFMCLANINENAPSYASGRPYSVMVSGSGSPDRYFEYREVEESAVFHLVGQTGEITGTSGGQRAVIFKRNSIYLQTYVGLPKIMDFTLISKAQGTSYPNSIVAVDQDVYFWGNGGIFVLRGGSQLERLSAGRVERHLFDTFYEASAVRQYQSANEWQNAGIVVGDYDSYSGCIMWLYSKKTDGVGVNTSSLIYSVKEGRFSTWEDLNVQSHLTGVGYIVSSKNVVSPETALTKGFLLVGKYNSGTALVGMKFLGDYTYPMRLKTKRMSSANLPDVEIGQDITIHKVRPIMNSSDDTIPPGTVIAADVYSRPVGGDSYHNMRALVEDQNLDGWWPLTDPKEGEFWEFMITVPELFVSKQTLKEVIGLQVIYSKGGFGA